MFLTESKELATKLVNGDTLENVKVVARKEIRNNPYRNCNFERTLIDVESENQFEVFKEHLKKIENSTFTVIFNGERKTERDYWNSDKITFN